LASAGGFEGDFYDITYGFNYKPNGNLTAGRKFATTGSTAPT